MLHTALEYLNMLFTNYMLAIFIASGIFLILLVIPSMGEENFAKEKKIAKIIGIGYIFFGVGMYIILFFINSFAF